MALRSPSSRDGAPITMLICDWTPQHEAAGLARNALYLLRPDTYVAVADTSGAPEMVDRYSAQRGLRLERTTETERAKRSGIAGLDVSSWHRRDDRLSRRTVGLLG